MTQWLLMSMLDWDLETWLDYIGYCFVVCLFFAVIGVVKEILQNRNSSRPTPMCPNCHGNNTGKITAVKRVLEQSTFGWAAPSSGNTFECYDCGYKW